MKNKKENKKISIMGKEVSKKLVIIGVMPWILIVCIIICILVVNCLKSDTYKITKKIYNYLEAYYDNIEIVEKDKDSKYNYSYIETVSIYETKDGKEVGKDDIPIVTVSKYNSNIEAQSKINFLKSDTQLMHKTFDNTSVELTKEYKEEFFTQEKNLLFTRGKYLFSIDSKIKNASNIEKIIDEFIKKYDVSDEKTVDKKSVDNYWNDILKEREKELTKSFDDFVLKVNTGILEYVDKLNGCIGNDCDDTLKEISPYEKYLELSDAVGKVKAKYNEIIKSKDEIANSISGSIESVKSSLDENEYNSIKTRISELKDSYYDKYKNVWNTGLETVEEGVYKKSCGIYDYKEILRNPDNYKGNKAYFFGKVTQKINDKEYRVGVDCSKSKYSTTYYCDNVIYVNYSGNVNLIEDDIIELWGTLDGTKTYTSVLWSSVTIPNFNAKYVNLK